jgi:hypothetical protein
VSKHDPLHAHRALTEFKESVGWLHTFTESYSMHHKTICGEESDATRDVVSPWKEQQLKDIIKQYSLLHRLQKFKGKDY